MSNTVKELRAAAAHLFDVDDADYSKRRLRLEMAAAAFLRESSYEVREYWNAERNKEVTREFVAGARAKDVGAKYGISGQRVRQITERYARSVNPSLFSPKTGAGPGIKWLRENKNEIGF